MVLPAYCERRFITETPTTEFFLMKNFTLRRTRLSLENYDCSVLWRIRGAIRDLSWPQRTQRGTAAAELTAHETANQRIGEWMSSVHVERDELTGDGWWSKSVSWKRKALLQPTAARTFL
jgi:hypothetical protein